MSTGANIIPPMVRPSAWLKERIHLLRSGRYPAEPVALFRIAGALVALLDVQATWDLAPLIWGTWRELSVVDAAYGGWSLVLVLLALGYRTTLMAVLNYLFTIPLILHLPHIYEYHFDYYLRTWALYLIFLQSGRAYSIDSLIARWRSRVYGTPAPVRTVPFWLVALFCFHFSLDYFDAGYRKLTDGGGMWEWGFGLYWPIVERFCSTGHGRWLLEYEWLLTSLSHLTVWLELLFPVLLLWRPTRVLAIVTGVGLHLGIVYVFPIRYFGEFMLALYLIFLPASWLGALRAWTAPRMKRRTVEYEPSCATCVRRAHLLDVLSPSVHIETRAGAHIKWRLLPGEHDSSVQARPEPDHSLAARTAGARRSRLILFAALAGVLLVCKLGHLGKLPLEVATETSHWARQISSFVEHDVFLSKHFRKNGILLVELEMPDGSLEHFSFIEPDGYPGDLLKASTRVWAFMSRVSMRRDPRALLARFIPWLEATNPGACAVHFSRKIVTGPREYIGRVDLWTDAPVQTIGRFPFRRHPEHCPPREP